MHTRGSTRCGQSRSVKEGGHCQAQEAESAFLALRMRQSLFPVW